MNERIKELLASPGLERLNDWASIGPVQRAAIEEFAELIVRDCAGYIHGHELFTALLNRYGVTEDWVAGARWAEAKLKEKNKC